MTTLVIVSLDEKGNRSFGFYRKETADTMINKSEIPFDVIKESKIFHFGSLSLTSKSSREATFSALEFAKQNGIVISYDPNYRETLWESPEKAKELILQGMGYANIIKISEEELFFLSDSDDFNKNCDSIFSKFKPTLLAVTLGDKGCFFRTQNGTFSSHTFDLECIDTTGAGDAFCGACLSKILEYDKPITELSDHEIHELMDYANAAGSLVTTKKGAIPAMPSPDEIELCLNNAQKLIC